MSTLADLALFTVLFVDGGRLSLRELRAGWRLSGRALGLGMPLALVLVAVATHYLVGLDWTTALLVGAILSPTDPVFASAIVGRSEVPQRLRRLLNVESGVNDGLALPFVLIFLALATGTEDRLGASPSSSCSASCSASPSRWSSPPLSGCPCSAPNPSCNRWGRSPWRSCSTALPLHPRQRLPRRVLRRHHPGHRRSAGLRGLRALR